MNEWVDKSVASDPHDFISEHALLSIRGMSKVTRSCTSWEK